MIKVMRMTKLENKLMMEYKQRIKNELELIGISRKSIYPDMQNKSEYIREKYL